VSDNVAGLVRRVLGSPTSELVMRRQILELARTNLHQPDVTAALLDSLPSVRDKETREALLSLLMTLDTSRFDRVDVLHDSLIRVFREEKERATRAELIARLADGLHQDTRLAAFFVEVLAEPSLSDQERASITFAVAALPSIDEATAATALDAARRSSTAVQAGALTIAERCPTWTDRVLAALEPYLDVRFDRAIRLRILRRLAEAKSLTPAHFTILRQTLRGDPDADARAIALDMLRSIRPWGEELFEQLLWTAAQDADEGLRAYAVALQREVPQLSDVQVTALAAQLATDRCTGVRTAVLAVLKPYGRAPEVRSAVLASFASNPSVFDDAELAAILDLLAPYVGRDAAVRDTLLASIETIPSAAQRTSLLEAVVPRLRAEDVVAPLATLFEHERDAALRRSLFGVLKPLSVTKHPELVKAYVAELVDPGSPFRAEVAAILGAAAELHAEVPPALEDVLLNDQDRDLVRACLEGYLRPKVARTFEPLLSVVRNEVVDTASRQRALDELMRMDLSEGESSRLADALAGLNPNTLRTQAQ
jgi:hypothetical protein